MLSNEDQRDLNSQQPQPPSNRDSLGPEYWYIGGCCRGAFSGCRYGICLSFVKEACAWELVYTRTPFMSLERPHQAARNVALTGGISYIPKKKAKHDVSKMYLHTAHPAHVLQSYMGLMASCGLLRFITWHLRSLTGQSYRKFLPGFKCKIQYLIRGPKKHVGPILCYL